MSERPLALLALAVFPLGCRGRADPVHAATAPAPPGEVRFEPGAPQLAFLSVDTVRPRSEKSIAILPAQLVMDEDHTVRVASPVTGRVLTLEAQAGDHVAPGQALARIASSDVGQAQSDLARATAALAVSTAAWERARDLYDHHVVALKDLQQSESDEAQARAERDRALARVQLLGATPTGVDQQFILRAPLGGAVVDRQANPGEEVRPDNAQPLFTITSLDTLWLAVNVFQRDLAAVHMGQRVVFTTDAVSGRRFLATVRYVSGTLDPDTRTALVRAVVPNPDARLRPLVYGEARLYAPSNEAVLVVPTEALVTRGSDTVVFVQLAPGRFVRRTVTIGADDGETAEVRNGVTSGELVVTHGALLLAAEADRVH
jgi:membrane fusion protein, heavy metal efflux system